MRFFTSDGHVGHHNVIKYDSRPFTCVEDMNATIIRRWNTIVSPEDTVYYLGDFCMNPKYLWVVSQLNGVKVLVPGNHDKCYWGSEKWTKRYLEAGFSTILPKVSSLTLSNGEEVVLSHVPYTNEDPRFVNVRPKDEGKWLLHGHVHVKWLRKDKQINVGVPVWDYYPVPEDAIVRIIERNG